ncbi:MAG: hypothetical protein Q9227_007609 [Pyrenula ochraceoflavens]
MVSCRVLIVGCSLSGLATAVTLRRSGHTVTIFEESEELQGALGISQATTQVAHEPAELTLRSYRGAVLSKLPLGSNIKSRYGSPYLVVNHKDLLHILLSEAKKLGVEVKFGANIAAIEFSTPSLILSTGETYEGDVMFGADGEDSACRNHLQQRSDPPRSTGDVVVSIAVPSREVSRRQNLADLVKGSSINAWMGPNAQATSCVLQKNDTLNILLICPEKTGRESLYGPQRASIVELREAFQDWDPKLQTLLYAGGTDCIKWSLSEIEEVVNWRSSSGRFALIGDAAHALLPYLAQSVPQDFEDASVIGTLFSSIKEFSQIPDALRIYEEIRKPRATEVRKRTDAQKIVYGLSDGPEQRRRDQELMAAARGKGFPHAVEDPDFQARLWGYDAELVAKQHWEEFLRNTA